MDFDKLQTFYHVAKSGSFTKAGDIVNLSQSAVSRQVIYLEDRLKTKLFKRKARGLSLTTPGEVLYERVRRILDEVDSLRTAISESDIYDKGNLIIVTTTALATMWLVPYMNEFCELHPKVDVTIVGDDNNLDLFFHNADAAIRTYIPHARQLIQEYLMSWNVCLFASKCYVEKHGMPKNPEDLQSHKLVSFGDSYSELPYADYNWHLRIGASSGHIHKPYFRINSAWGLLTAAKKGLGITPLSQELGSLLGPELVRVLPEVRGPSVDVFYTYPKELKSSERVRALLDYLQEKIPSDHKQRLA